MKSCIELPFPPSVNTYYRAISRGKFCQSIISKKGREYKELVKSLIGDDEITSDRLSVSIGVYPPDKRRRDLDNRLKALLDSLTGRIWVDDEQIDKLFVERKEIVKGGKVEITVEAR